MPKQTFAFNSEIRDVGRRLPLAARADALSPLEQTQALVQKYAKTLLDDKRAGQFAATVALLARKNPELAKATHESFLTAIMACVHLDLMPNTPEGYAYIIPYKNYRSYEGDRRQNCSGSYNPAELE